jgi:fucose permease
MLAKSHALAGLTTRDQTIWIPGHGPPHLGAERGLPPHHAKPNTESVTALDIARGKKKIHQQYFSHASFLSCFPFFVFSGSIYFIVKIWGEDSPGPLTAATSSFILGAAISPLIALPFLSERPTNTSIRYSAETEVALANASNGVITSSDFRRDKKIETLYFILMGITCVIGIGMALGSALVSRSGESLTKEETRTGDAIITKGSIKIILIILMCVFIMMIIGLEINIYGMLAPYIILGLHGTEQEGTIMVSYLWGIYAVFSLSGIAAYHYFTPSTILLANLVLMIVANVVLVVCDPTWKTLWIGSTLLSVGFAGTYGGVFLWADFYLDLSHQVSAVLVVGSQLGSVVVPLVTGPLFAADPFSLMKITLICVIICAVLFVLVEVIAYQRIRIHRPTSLGLRKLREQGYRDMDKH